MKKSVKLAVAATVFATPAMAADVPGQIYSTVNNMENPLYLPARNMFYSKLSNGVMLKVADSSKAHKMKNHDGSVEFPILRIQEELGYGITDRWAVHGSVQYTHDNDIGRTGLSAGRIGTTYRILNKYNGYVWDMYGDVHLGGVGEMRGTYNIKVNSLVPTPNVSGVMDYDNYSNGMWGLHFGTKFGRVWNDKFTTSAFVEALRSFGDDNNMIRLAGDNQHKFIAGMNGSTPVMATTAQFLAGAYAPNQISAELKSTWEVSAGLNAFYQWSDRISTGAWFRYNHHASQGVEKITTAVEGQQLNMLKTLLEKQLADMQDGFDEYIIGLSWATQMTQHAQVALYGEYTFDTAKEKSQNGTDVKAEVGVRVNFTF